METVIGLLHLVGLIFVGAGALSLMVAIGLVALQVLGMSVAPPNIVGTIAALGLFLFVVGIGATLGADTLEARLLPKPQQQSWLGIEELTLPL